MWSSIKSVLHTQHQAPPIQAVSHHGPLPTSFAQQRLWSFQQAGLDSISYNISSAYRLTGPLNCTFLVQGLNEVIRRHEALRITFEKKEDQLVQFVKPELELDLSVVDLRALSARRKWAEVQKLEAQEVTCPFDLERGPLMRVKLIHLADEEYLIFLTAHHIIVDGWSLANLFKELSAYYQARVENADPSLPYLPIQFVDFVIWQRQWLQGEVLERQLSYWRQQLGNGPRLLALPTDHLQSPPRTFHGIRRHFTCSPSLTDALKKLSQQERVTLFITLLTAFKVFLFFYTHQTDILLVSPTANRNRVELKELIGLFANMLALRTEITGDITFVEALSLVHKVVSGAYAHQDIPFEQILEELKLVRNERNATPLFQTMFALRNFPKTPLCFPGIQVQPVELQKATTEFDLALSITETEQGLKGRLQYRTDRFEETTIDLMILHFKKLLENVVTDPHARLLELIWK